MKAKSDEIYMGLDIGYSNVSARIGNGETSRDIIFPAGAAHKRHAPQLATGGGASDVFEVVVDDDPWVAGLEPDRLGKVERQLHRDYPKSSNYLALFYAALAASGETKIDVLTTGLPVDQFKDIEYRQALVNRLQGTHNVSPKLSIEVSKVVVVPQPAGAYMSLVNSNENEDIEDIVEIILNGRMLVIDPGYFSTDWVLFDCGEVRFEDSDTSLHAMSTVIGGINDMIRQDYAVAPGPAKIEKAIRSGSNFVFASGQKVDITEYREKSADEQAEEALTKVIVSLRASGENMDVVLMTGGGGADFSKVTKQRFPNSKFVSPENSVTSISDGFYYISVES